MSSSIIDIVKSMYLLDFYERKNNTIITAASEELNSLSEHFKDRFVCDGFKGRVFQYRDDFLKRVIKCHYRTIFDILVFAEGKISLCGICILDLMESGKLGIPERFHLYVHSCDLLEANSLIYYCIKILGNNILLTKEYVDIFCTEMVVRIYLSIFQDRSSILMNIGPAPERHGYDPKTGYFSTFNGVLSLVMKASPIDINPNINKWSTYYSRNIVCISHAKKGVSVIPDLSSFVGVYSCEGKWLYNEYFNLEPFNLEPSDIVDENYEVKYDIVLEGLTTIHNNIIKLSINPRDCFGKDYVPIVVGISNDRFIAFAKIKDIVKEDLFKLLCDYWLEAEVFDTKRRLLNKDY